jgi:hypothetical protein
MQQNIDEFGNEMCEKEEKKLSVNFNLIENKIIKKSLMVSFSQVKEGTNQQCVSHIHQRYGDNLTMCKSNYFPALRPWGLRE